MYLRDTFSVMRSSLVSDGMGGYSETLTVAKSDAVGYLRQLSAAELVIFAQKNRQSTFRLYCSDIDVTISDVLSIRRYAGSYSQMYEIENIDPRYDLSSGQLRGLQIDLYIED